MVMLLSALVILNKIHAFRKCTDMYKQLHMHSGIEITLRPDRQWRLDFASDQQKIWKITCFSPEWRAKNLILICTLKKCLVCFWTFWLKLSSDFAVMSEENDVQTEKLKHFCKLVSMKR